MYLPTRSALYIHQRKTAGTSIGYALGLGRKPCESRHQGLARQKQEVGTNTRG